MHLITPGNRACRYKITKDNIKKYEDIFHKELEVIYNTIKDRKVSRGKDVTITEPIPQILLEIVPFLNSVFRPVGEFFRFKSHFYSDKRCTGCGICEKVCLSNKIKMVDKKPVWQKNVQCFYCYACINYCPGESVQIKSWTEKNSRYSHPYATVNDIAAQN